MKTALSFSFAISTCVLVAACGARTELLPEGVGPEHGAGAPTIAGGSSAGGHSAGNKGGNPACDHMPTDGGGGKVQGALDPTKDNDGDGYAYAQDCDDADASVNASAFDVPGNGVDDDCNGVVDEVATCDGKLAFDSSDPVDFAHAMGFCDAAKTTIPGKSSPGLLAVALSGMDGEALDEPAQHGIFTGFGPNVPPREGAAIAALSTGRARLPGQPGYEDPTITDQESNHLDPVIPGLDFTTPGCPPPIDDIAHDAIVLDFSLQAPSNAHALIFDLDFYSAEYPGFVCTQYNDALVVLVDDATGSRGNVAFDSKGNPITVNNAFFEVCEPLVADGESYDCPLGTAELDGTGFGIVDKSDGNNGDSFDERHAATSWLELHVPVRAGEPLRVRIAVWDVSDAILDSMVLLDHARWSTEEPPKAVTERPCDKTE